MFEVFHISIMALFLVNVVMTVAVMEVPEGYSALHYRIIGLSCAKVAAGLALVNLVVSIGAGIQGQVAFMYLIILIALVAYVLLQEQALKKYKRVRSIPVKKDVWNKTPASSQKTVESPHEETAHKKLEERKEALRSENSSGNFENTSEDLSEVDEAPEDENVSVKEKKDE